MRKKILYWLRYIMIGLSMVIAMVFYLSTYDIDEGNIPEKIGARLEVSDVEILEKHFVSEGEKAMILHYKTSQGSGMALLQRGINGRYQISDLHPAEAQVKCIEYLVNGYDYSVILGRKDVIISDINFVTQERQHTEVIEDTDIFILRKTRGFNGTLEVVDVNGAKELMTLETQRGKVWQNVLMPLYCIGIIFFTYLLSIPLNYKLKQYKLSDINEIPLEGQRIKQMRQW